MRTHCRVVNPDKELFVSDPDPAKITKKRINNQNFTSFCFTEIKVECSSKSDTGTVPVG